MNLKKPLFFFSKPFADSGDKSIIGESAPSSGRATLAEGFPPSTSQPLSSGGVAPSRLDFNGILYMLSSFAFWQQSGGMWSWSETLDYAPDCLVLDNGALYWCVSENGPGTSAGAVRPSADSENARWVPLLKKLSETPSGASLGVPAGTIIAYYGRTAPEGYLACDGTTFSASRYPELYKVLGSALLPDMRGMFVRGLDPSARNDPDGAGRNPGSRQNDAGRNVTGSFAVWSDIFNEPDGSVYATNKFTIPVSNGAGNYANVNSLLLDASRSWNSGSESHTAGEFRPKNVALLYCIKY